MAVALVFVIIQMQQKTAKRLLWYRMTATVIGLVAVSFIGVWSVIILMLAGILRVGVALYFAYNPNTKTIFKVIAGILIIALIITLNIIFWEGWISIFSMVFGASMVVMYLQKTAKTIRKFGILVGILGVTFYVIQLMPMNIAIELLALISVIVGIIRLDRATQDKKPAMVFTVRDFVENIDTASPPPRQDAIFKSNP